jgi:hypothetical protein
MIRRFLAFCIALAMVASPVLAGLTVNQVVGFNVRASTPSGPVVITQTASPAGVASVSTTSSYTGTSIGTASANRIVAVLVATELALALPNRVQVGGVTLTAVAAGNNGSIYARLFYGVIATGSTATIDVRYDINVTASQNRIAVYSVTGANATPLSSGADGSPAADGLDPLTTGSITIPTNGGFLAVAANGQDGAAMTWTNATEDIDIDGGNMRFSTATRTTAGTVTITAAGNNDPGALSWIVFNPG